MNMYYNNRDSWDYMSISNVIAYMIRQENKNQNIEYYDITNDMMNIAIIYFQHYAVCKSCPDLTMDCQLKYKGKPVICIGSM